MPDRTVFIVDDDEAIRDSLCAMLEIHGFAVRAFASAGTFLERFDPDWRGCLLLDIKMPGMDGRALQQRLAERQCRLPIVFITGHGDVAMAVEAMRAGAADFLEKPIDPKQLLHCVRRNLEAGGAGALAPEPEAAARLEKLTPREKEVMALVVRGLQNKHIARELGISPRTVELHRARVMEKMQAGSVAALVRMAIPLGIMAE